MYDTSHSAPMNGVAGDLVDGSGTINPAALDNGTFLFFFFSFVLNNQ